MKLQTAFRIILTLGLLWAIWDETGVWTALAFALITLRLEIDTLRWRELAQ